MTRDKGDLCAEHKRSRVAAGARLPGGEEKGKWTKLSYRANGTLSYTFPPYVFTNTTSFDSVGHLSPSHPSFLGSRLVEYPIFV